VYLLLVAAFFTVVQLIAEISGIHSVAKLITNKNVEESREMDYLHFPALLSTFIEIMGTIEKPLRSTDLQIADDQAARAIEAHRRAVPVDRHAQQGSGAQWPCPR
jgi:hypothetical protein